MNPVYWINVPTASPRESGSHAPMQLAIVPCPRGGRFLHDELHHLRRTGIQALVSLLSDEQVEMLDLAEEPLLATRMGIQFLHHPIPDHQLPPDPEAFRAFVGNLAHRLDSGQRIAIHCWGSIGRATVVAACTLIHLGWEPYEALVAVESARGCPVPDTQEQESFILHYSANA